MEQLLEQEQFSSKIRSLNLSPLEKIMIVYDRLKKYDLSSKSNNIVINKLFYQCVVSLGYQSCIIESSMGDKSHIHVIVNIDDDKYDIHGMYHFDPFCDCLPKSVEDNSISYNYFCRNLKEMNSLKKSRAMNGVSSVIMGKDSITSCIDENPFRTLEIVSAFYKDSDIDKDIEFINQYRHDIETKPNYWPTVNKKYELSIAFIRDKVSYAPEVPLNVIVQIIENVRRIENSRISNDDLSEKIESILIYNNQKFLENFNDTRLLFPVKPKNYVNKEQYKKVLEEIEFIYSNKSETDIIRTVVEFTNDQKQQALLKIISVDPLGEQVIVNYTFDDTFDFATKFLNPLIQLHADNFSYKMGRIEKTEYLNLRIRNYNCESDDGNLFSIIGGQLGYLQNVDQFLKNNSKINEEQLKKTSGNQKLYKKDNGFANVILLAHITGISIGLIIMSIYLIVR